MKASLDHQMVSIFVILTPGPTFCVTIKCEVLKASMSFETFYLDYVSAAGAVAAGILFRDIRVVGAMVLILVDSWILFGDSSLGANLKTRRGELFLLISTYLAVPILMLYGEIETRPIQYS